MVSDESWNQADNHRLCANGCGFFGTAATLNLCSKCYRDFRMKEEQAASAKAAVDKSFNPPIPNSSKDPDSLKSFASSGEASAAGGSVGVGDSVSPQPGSSGSTPNRCRCCRKRVGLTGFTCRCGSTFCGAHRYPEKHDCRFDFKGVGRDAIAKANPVVKADKLERV